MIDFEFADGVDHAEIEVTAAAIRGHFALDDAGDISHPALRAVYQAALEIRDDERFSAAAIVAQLRSTDTLRSLRIAGGLDLVVKLVAFRPLLSSLSYFARIVRSAARRRQLIAASIVLHSASQRDDDEELDRALRAIETAATS